MTEQRLIDATDLIARGNASFGGVSDAVLLKNFVDAQPTIDPETIPIVRQLMEENARLRNEVMRIRKFENLPMHTIIFEMKYADFMDAGRVEELAAEVLIGLMAKDAASRHHVKEVTL